MEKSRYEIEYSIFHKDELSKEDLDLLHQAKQARTHAYAPYSNFRVGCALLMSDKRTVTGSNQENASFPAGLCAEKVALSAASSIFPGVAITKIAISTSKDDELLTAPCGICRQSLIEYEMRFEQNIAILLSQDEKVYYFESAKALLPFAFDKNALLKN